MAPTIRETETPAPDSWAWAYDSIAKWRLQGFGCLFKGMDVPVKCNEYANLKK